MDVKELAEQHQVKIFDTTEAATAEGFVLLETFRPRNVWNRQSAAQSTIYKLIGMRQRGEASTVGLVLDPWSVAGCYKKAEGQAGEAPGTHG